MALDPISSALDLGKTVIDKIWPDAGESERNKVQLILTMFQAQAQIVIAEASSGSWLTRSWRPITMLIFVGLITARWFGYSATNLSPAEYLELWGIVKLGLGGYVIGRSAEKIVPGVATTVSNILRKSAD